MSKRFIAIVFLFIAFHISAQKNIYAPALTTPTDKAINQAADVLLLWNGVANAYSYKLQIDTIVPANDLNSIKVVNATSYTRKKLIFNKTYYWRVKAFNIDFETGKSTDSSAWSSIFSFKVINTVFLFSPQNNAITQRVPLTISWTAIAGATSYDYEVDITPYFNSKFIIPGTNSNPTAPPATSVVLSNLLTGTTYYWRVRAGHSLSQTGWSDVRKFSTILNITDEPQLFSPLNNAINQSPSTNLRWYALQNAKSYTYQIDTSAEFLNPKTGINITATNVIATKLLFNHQYYWRVKGVSDNNTSSWSEVYSFRVFSFPLGVAPIEGAKNQDIKGLKFSVDPTIAGVEQYEFQLDTSLTFDSKWKQSRTTKGGDTTFANSLKPSSVYHWRVQARLIKTIKDTSDWSPIYTFTTNDGHLAAPLLITPINNAVNQNTNLLLNWTAVTGATSYRIQLDTLADFSKAITKSTSGLNIGSLALLNGKTYFWKVRALNTTSKKDTSKWSETYSFSTNSVFPKTAVLYLPLDHSINQMPNVTLLWRQSIDASKYVYQLDIVGNFDTPLKSDTISEFTKTLNELSFGQLYYWRVKSVKNGVYSDWSDVYSFSIIRYPVQSIPANNSIDLPIENVTLNWNKISGITNYEVQFDLTNSFDSPTIYNPTDSLIVLNNLKFSTEYFWRVRAIHSKSTSEWSDIRSFTTVRKVIILSPKDNSTNLASQITLSFTALLGATEYYYQLDTEFPPFMGNEKQDSTYGLSEYKINNLIYGMKYYLRVKALNSNTSSEWSDTITFTILSKPTLLTPADNAINQMPDVKIGWQNINGALIYNYQVDINNKFLPNSLTLISKTSTNNLLSPDTLDFGTKYFWQVNVTNSASISSYSDIWSFTTIDTVKVISPVDDFNASVSKDVAFKWTKITGIKNYELQMANNENFDIHLPINKYVIVPTVDNYTVKGVKNGAWWWRLRAKTSTDSTQWSIARSLKVTVGIEDLNENVTNVDVYPVPCKDNCFIRFDNFKSNNTIYIDVLNLLGQSILNHKYELNSNGNFIKEVDLSNVENGIYFVKILNANNSTTRKILVQK